MGFKGRKRAGLNGSPAEERRRSFFACQAGRNILYHETVATDRHSKYRHPSKSLIMEIFTAAGLTALLQVIAIDLVLAGDNAIVIGLAAAGLPAHQRNKAILVGIIAATILRISFATVTAYLLGIVGLQLLGGLLLAWVCWKMWTELRSAEQSAAHALSAEEAEETNVPRKTFLQAATQIVIADVSMSLDNVLAVAGAAREHTSVLIIGLVLSIALMGLAANLVARLLHRYRWIAYVGLAVIVYVAGNMIYHGFVEVWPHVQQWLA
jgi:YjbE family integral membrane protein